VTLFERARTTPHDLAVDDLERRLTWSELADRVHRVAHHLHDACGLRPGDHVAVLVTNRAEYAEILLGALWAGVIVTPVNWHLAPSEVRYILHDSGARLLFLDPVLADRAEGTSVPSLLLGPPYEAALAGASAAPVPLEAPVGATMAYTSGTTGLPKGVLRFRPPNLRGALAAYARAGTLFGLDGRGPHLLAGPMYHAAPGLFALYDLVNGAPLVMMPRWDERLALRLIEERRIRHTHLVPTMFVRLLRLPEEERTHHDLSSLSLVHHGAAPIAPDIKRAMIAWWGPVLVEYWGATEGGVYTLIDSEDWLAHPGSVGRAIETFEVFAVDDEGRRLGPDQVGRLYCRHREREDVFVYHGDPAKTAASYLSPGVFTAGDVGRVDAEGYVFLEGRRSDLILSGGVNVYPAEVAAVLSRHPAVVDVAVFGIPDPEWGEVVHAVVELDPGLQPSDALADALCSHARSELAGYKVPRAIDFVAALPRHPNGKVRLHELREAYAASRG